MGKTLNLYGKGQFETFFQSWVEPLATQSKSTSQSVELKSNSWGEKARKNLFSALWPDPSRVQKWVQHFGRFAKCADGYLLNEYIGRNDSDARFRTDFIVSLCTDLEKAERIVDQKRKEMDVHYELFMLGHAYARKIDQLIELGEIEYAGLLLSRAQSKGINIAENSTSIGYAYSHHLGELIKQDKLDRAEADLRKILYNPNFNDHIHSLFWGRLLDIAISHFDQQNYGQAKKLFLELMETPKKKSAEVFLKRIETKSRRKS